MTNAVRGFRGGAILTATIAFSSLAIAMVATTVATPAWSAVVTVVGPPSTGTQVALSESAFTRLGNCGGGGSVVGNGCQVLTKFEPNPPVPYGRFDPLDPLGGYWIDSQDIDDLQWSITSPEAFTSMTFALTDAHDQLNSFFEMSYWDGTVWEEIWDIPTQLLNGNLFWLMVTFDSPVTAVDFRFLTKVGDGFDGYGISALSVAPVPLPPAALLLLTGTALMAGLRRRRRAAATA